MRTSDNQNHSVVDIEHGGGKTQPIVLVVVEFHRDRKKQTNVSTVKEITNSVRNEERRDSRVSPQIVAGNVETKEDLGE